MYRLFKIMGAVGVKANHFFLCFTPQAGNGRLKEIAYANGDKMKAAYNGVGQMVAEKWYDVSNNLTAHYKYVYDGKGNIVRLIMENFSFSS